MRLESGVHVGVVTCLVYLLLVYGLHIALMVVGHIERAGGAGTSAGSTTRISWSARGSRRA